MCIHVVKALYALDVCTLLLCICVGGAHRCYESRRRVYNDSRPERREQVQKNLKMKKRKSYQTGVCLIHYLAEFFSFPSLAVQKKREVYRDGQRRENVG